MLKHLLLTKRLLLNNKSIRFVKGEATASLFFIFVIHKHQVKIMRVKQLLIFIAFLFSFGSIESVTANDPIKIRFGIFVKKISPDFKESMFKTEFYWWIRFENDSNLTGISNEEILNLEYVNGVETGVDIFKDEIIEQREISPNSFYFHGFHQGDFYFSPDFRMYPFDQQKLHISIENTLLPETDFIILADEESYSRSNQQAHLKGLSSDLINQERESFSVLKSEILSGVGFYNTDFGDPEFSPVSNYSRIDTVVYLKRPIIPYISKLIIPLIIILLLVYYVFFLPPDKIDISAGLTVTSLLSAIAFQLAIGSELPDIGYIIYSDKVFYVCYFLIALSMAQSLYTYYLDVSGDEKKVRLAVNLDIIFRFIFPILFFVPVILMAL